MRNVGWPVLLAFLVVALIVAFVVVVFMDAPPEGPELAREEGETGRPLEGTPSATATAVWVEPEPCREELDGMEACHHVRMVVQAPPEDDFPAGAALWVAQDEQGSSYGSVWVEPREPVPAGQQRNVTVLFPAGADVRLQEVRHQHQEFPVVSTAVPEYEESGPPLEGRGTGTGVLLFIPRSRFWRGYAVCRC